MSPTLSHSTQLSALAPIDTLISNRLQIVAPSWLQILRSNARAQLSERGLPGKRWESWHYSAADSWLQAFDAKHGLSPLPAAVVSDAVSADQFSSNNYSSKNTLQFSHGHLVAQQFADADAEALTLLPLAQLDLTIHANIIDWLSTHPHTDSLAAVATALAPESWVLIVHANANVSQPIVISQQTSQTGAQIGQLIVWVEANAQAAIVENYTGVENFTGAEAAIETLQITHTQIHVGSGARLTYARLNSDSTGTQNLGVVEGDVQRDAQLRVQVLHGSNVLHRDKISDQNQRLRTGLYIRLQENGAEFTARGAFAAAGSQHIDYHFTVDHNADHGRSDVQVQGIAGDTARGIINGRIHIAAKTRANDGHFTSHNLLLSNDAEIYTKPELEIYADEVRCDHGATVGQFDEDQLLYLLTRGIDRDAAIALMTEGFLKAGLLDTGTPALNDYLQQQLLQSIGGGDA